MDRPVVLVVDMQNDYCSPEGALGRGGASTAPVEAMLPRLERFLETARAHGVPVVFLQTIHEDATDSDAWRSRSVSGAPEICRRGSWGAEFALAPAEGEPVVVKHRYSGFVNTRLESVLHTLDARTLLMTGVTTNVCVESTARHGFMLDYAIVLVEDCCAAYEPAEHDGALYNIRTHFGTVQSSDEVFAGAATR